MVLWDIEAVDLEAIAQVNNKYVKPIGFKTAKVTGKTYVMGGGPDGRSSKQMFSFTKSPSTGERRSVGARSMAAKMQQSGRSSSTCQRWRQSQLSTQHTLVFCSTIYGPELLSGLGRARRPRREPVQTRGPTFNFPRLFPQLLFSADLTV